jgi:hypothetical protein
MSKPTAPTPPKGDNLIQTKREGSTPAPMVHRESGKPMVKTT